MVRGWWAFGGSRWVCPLRADCLCRCRRGEGPGAACPASPPPSPRRGLPSREGHVPGPLGGGGGSGHAGRRCGGQGPQERGGGPVVCDGAGRRRHLRRRLPVSGAAHAAWPPACSAGFDGAETLPCGGGQQRTSWNAEPPRLSPSSARRTPTATPPHRPTQALPSPWASS
jgi:hypothetical protein